ncbi:MAG: hypothetical protein WA722_07690 [Candidatus Sulfotelmatobacter sp.]
MKTIRRSSSIIYVATIAVVMVALPARLAAQAVAAKSPDTSSGPATQWSVQVDRVNAGDQELAYSFQVAIYENLLEELNKTKQFKYVLREGDSKASELPDLLILKTTVVKYTRGSETQRAVTTVSGATKLTVRSQLITRDGKPVLDRTVQGNVRFFGSNLRATHNLARNIAKMIKQSAWQGSDRLARYSPVDSDCGRQASPGF